MPDVCRALCPLLKNVTGTGCVCFYLDTDDKNCTCNSEVSKVKYGEMNLFQSAYHHGYWLCIYYVRYVLFTTAMIYCYDMFKN